MIYKLRRQDCGLSIEAIMRFSRVW